MPTLDAQDEPPTPRRQRTGVSSSSLRIQNLSSVLQLVHLSGPATRSDICSATGLTRSSVAALVGELESSGLVQEGRAVSDGKPGRPSPVVEAAPGQAVLAFEALVDSVAVAVVGLGGKVLSQRRHNRIRESVSVEQTVKDFARLATACLSDAGDPMVLSSGAAVAGVVDHRTDTVVFAPNLGWENAELRTAIQVECGLDGPLAVRNDGRLALRAEARRGAGRGCDDLIYLNAEVGLGGGLLSGGHIIIGRDGLGGEIGHLPVNPEGEICKCGARGCFETEVGERALLTHAGLDPNGGRIEIAKLLAQAKAGEASALESFHAAGRWLGLGIAGLANTLGTDKVVLGGLYQPGFDFVITAIKEVLAQRAFPTLDQLKVVPSVLGEDAPLLGAAELAFDRVLADPLGFRAG